METIRNKQGSYTDNDFWANYGSETPRLCLCVKVTPVAVFGGAGAALGFTSNTRDLILPGHSVVFSATPAITPTQVEKSLDETFALELTGIFNSESFTEEEIIAGKWNYAAIEIFVVSWQNTGLGEWVAAAGYLGETKTMQTYFTAEVRGKLSLLSNAVEKVTANLCRVKVFGDTECKKDLSGTVTINGAAYNLKQTLTVSSVISNFSVKFTNPSPGIPDAFFNNGTIMALGATANGGASREIKRSYFDTGGIVVELKRRFPFPVVAGTQFLLTAGCDRTLENCVLYANVINRQAEDWLPGIEAANSVPTAVTA